MGVGMMAKEESARNEDILNAIIENQVVLNDLKKQLRKKNLPYRLFNKKQVR